MPSINGTLLLVVITLALLCYLLSGCGSRMDKFREFRQQQQEQRHERRDERQEKFQDWFGNRFGRGQERERRFRRAAE